jgi:RHS repeat-associated protein
VQRYIYSGSETVSVYDGSDNWVRDFAFGSRIDEVLMIEQADVLDYDGDQNTSETTRSFYHLGALGSVMEITDMNEAEVVSYRYDPYGAVTITVGGTPQSSDPLGNPWTYTGRFHDEETGLHYYRARYYSPETGRFLARDPLGYDAGTNLYAYVDSDPLRYRDPSGTTIDPLDGINHPEEFFGPDYENERFREEVDRRFFKWDQTMEGAPCWVGIPGDHCRGTCGPASLAGGEETVTSARPCHRSGTRPQGAEAEALQRIGEAALSSARSAGNRTCQRHGTGCECQIKIKNMSCHCQDSRRRDAGGWTLTINCKKVTFEERKCARK